MLLFESLIFFISTITLLIFSFSKKEIKKKYILYTLLAILFLHFIVEGYRWQIIPSYILVCILIYKSLKESKKKTKLFIKIINGLLLLLLIILGIILPTVFPVFDIPKSTGQYNVGTKDLLLELNRDEIITEAKNDKRKIMIKAWYPTNDKEGEMDLYIDQGGRHGFAQKYGLPNSTFNYLDKVETNVYKNASISNNKFPVLIFSHGYNSKANNYYALLSQIVSEGYIVLAINHSYESTGSTFPDGSEIYFDYSYAHKIESDTWKDMAPVVKAFKEKLPFEKLHPIVKKGLKKYFVRGMVERWAKDISNVVDQLDSWNNLGFFKNKIDINNIGVFGHSRGGGAAGETLLTDKRIKVGVNVDGVQWGRIVDTCFQTPFLYISADWPEEKEDLNSHAYINKSKSIFYEAKVLETGHSSFMDIPFMIPLKALNEAGDIDPKLSIEITSNLITSFFDKYLKEKQNSDPIDISKKYKNLEMKVFKNNSQIK